MESREGKRQKPKGISGRVGIVDGRPQTADVGAHSAYSALRIPHSALWRDPFLWLSLALTIFAVAPFLLPGYFWGANDARHHVYFLFEFDRLVQDGIWWPRWSPDFAFGYGYPFFNIYGPLSHFLAQLLLHFGGLSHTTAVKSIFGLGIVLSAGTMYGYVRSLAGRRAGLLAAVVYTYIPYHLLVLYVRGNLAESTAFLWLPLCLWSFREMVRRPSFGWIAAGAISYAGLLLTSNLVFVLFTPLLVLYILVLLLFRASGVRQQMWQAIQFVRSAVAPALGGILGIGLGAVFLIPMVLERNYVRTDQWFDGRYNYRDDFLYFFQLFSPRWGFGSSQTGPDDPIGFQLGAVALLFAILGIFVSYSIPRLRPEVVIFPIVAIGTIAVGLGPFAFLWEWPIVGGILQSAQFPWRWLPIAALLLSILAGLLLAEDEDPLVTDAKGSSFSLTLLAPVAVVILASYPLLQVEISEPAEGPVGLAALMRFQRDADEMTGSTVWVREIPTWSPIAEHYVVELDEARLPVTPITSKVDYESVDYEQIAVGSVAHNTVMEEIYFCTEPGNRPGDCTPRSDQRIVFNHFYYPGWRAYLLNGEQGEIVEELPIVPEGCLPPGETTAEPGRMACPGFPTYAEAATRIALETRESTLGRMVVPVPPVGEGYILLRYEDTPPRRIGGWISLATVAILVVAGLLNWRRSKRGQ
jgi:hypothetical protein